MVKGSHANVTVNTYREIGAPVRSGANRYTVPSRHAELALCCTNPTLCCADTSSHSNDAVLISQGSATREQGCHRLSHQAMSVTCPRAADLEQNRNAFPWWAWL